MFVQTVLHLKFESGTMVDMETYEYKLSDKRIMHACLYHVVWCPTFRRPVLTEPMRVRMKELIQEVCEQQQIEILELDIQANCVYLHCAMPPLDAVNNLVRKMKRKTSSMLCSEFPELRSRLPSLWTLHYFVSTEKEKPEKAIRKWMETQPRFAPKHMKQKTQERKEVMA